MIKIEQPFNNNVVMGWDRKHGEVVIVGKGIGFHAKKGDIIDERNIIFHRKNRTRWHLWIIYNLR